MLTQAKNLADYQSKHHIGMHHQAVCPWYSHTKIHPLYYLKQPDLAIWKGVLEPSPRDAYMCVSGLRLWMGYCNAWDTNL